MRISYPQRSRFLLPIENAIQRDRDALLSGTPITVTLSPQGYSGNNIRVTIEETNPHSFWTDWESTRFPQRIKVAAWALFRQGCFGEFEISHYTGDLTIRYISGDEMMESFKDKGISLYNLGRYEESVGCLDKALESNPLDFDAWNLKGSALSNLERYEEAINCYDRAILRSTQEMPTHGITKGLPLVNWEDMRKR